MTAFVVFDLLWMDGRGYWPQPLLFRKCPLTVIPGQRGVDLFCVTCERDLERIVAKHG